MCTAISLELTAAQLLPKHRDDAGEEKQISDRHLGFRLHSADHSHSARHDIDQKTCPFFWTGLLL